jgi:hypothetical protein
MLDPELMGAIASACTKTVGYLCLGFLILVCITI